MAEYIERGRALEIVKRTSGDYAAAWSEIGKLPAADVVEVVRCKDCKHYQKDMLFGNAYCDGRQVKPDDFCSYGERKETNAEIV